jgi:hypothetical protein
VRTHPGSSWMWVSPLLLSPVSARGFSLRAVLSSAPASGRWLLLSGSLRQRLPLASAGRWLLSPRMATLNLKCAAAWRRFWGLRTDRYDVVAGGVIVGRIFLSPTAPGHRPWMWTSNEHKGRPPAFGYEPTRDQAMLAFARSWHRE